MPFLEFILALIGLALLLAVTVGALIVFGGVACIIAIICFFTGWLPIMMCITDPNFTVGVGFIGIWALASLCVYGAIVVGVIIVSFLPLDPTDLPPGLKVLAMIYPTPFGEAITDARTGGLLDLSYLATRLKYDVAKTWMRYGKTMRTWQYQEAAKDIHANAKYMNAQADFHRAAEAYNRAKLRADEAERARRHR